MAKKSLVRDGVQKRIVMCGLNIVTHPHSPESYVKLVRALYALKRPLSIRGTQHLMIGELGPITKGDLLSGMQGSFYRFDQIDPNAPWFNVDNHEAATEDEMAKVSIPSSLKPNLKMFDFVFFPKGHHLYLESLTDGQTLSPLSALKLLAGLCQVPSILREFGDVEITVVPDKESLEEIFRLYRLAKLSIDVKKPNPDDLEDEEEQVFARLERMGTRRIIEILSAEPGQTIAPDDEVKLLARVAANNGSVKAVGYSVEGERFVESTVDKPLREPIYYDPTVQTSGNALIEGARTYHANRRR